MSDDVLGETRGGECDNRFDAFDVLDDLDEIDIVLPCPVTELGRGGSSAVGGGRGGEGAPVAIDMLLRDACQAVYACELLVRFGIDTEANGWLGLPELPPERVVGGGGGGADARCKRRVNSMME